MKCGLIMSVAELIRHNRMGGKVLAAAGCLLMISTSAVPCVAQTPNALISGFSSCEFRCEPGLTDVEVYLSLVPRRGFVNGSSGTEVGRDLVSNLEINYNFQDLTTDSVTRESQEIPVRSEDFTGLRTSGGVVTVASILLRPGKYLATVIAAEESKPAFSDTVHADLAVRMFPDSGLNISDIEMCTNISEATSSRDPYYKNTLDVVPNPRALYGIGLPEVQYYAEIYGLHRFHNTTEYGVNWSIDDTSGNVLQKSSIGKSGTSHDVVQIGSADISGLQSGEYHLVCFVADSIAGEHDSASTDFFVYNPQTKGSQPAEGQNQNVPSAPFDTMAARQLDAIFHAANYLETPAQTNTYKTLSTLPAKRLYLSQFWAVLNKKAGENGFNSWLAFDGRFKYANEKFKTSFTSGWLMDRGRVFIEFGQPDYIQRHFSSADMKPYEVWDYNAIQGGVIFVFVDLTGFNDYVLVHSTMQGEVSNPDWLRSL